jgi:hypothetical protein
VAVVCVPFPAELMLNHAWFCATGRATSRAMLTTMASRRYPGSCAEAALSAAELRASRPRPVRTALLEGAPTFFAREYPPIIYIVRISSMIFGYRIAAASRLGRSVVSWERRVRMGPGAGKLSPPAPMALDTAPQKSVELAPLASL